MSFNYSAGSRDLQNRFDTRAQFIVLVEARSIYPNCPRFIHKYELVERSRFVPHAATPTPIPAWKESEWARDVLPANDPARSSD